MSAPVFVAMSGGVDSSGAAALLLERGENVVGVWMRVVDAADGTRRLHRARDLAKDQSYALYMLGQRELSRTLFPIGELANKTETREIATRFGLPTATKAESMDICFVAGDYRDLVRGRAPQAFD